MPAGIRMSTVFPPSPRILLPVAGLEDRFPVRRVYCVGRNYAANAIEMGHDPDREPPFFFQKNPDNLLVENETFPYPTMSQDVHHEIELAVALKSGGAEIAAADALNHVYGYGVAIDFTRRDLQAEAKAAGRPWEVAKAFEHSAPMSAIQLATLTGHPTHSRIWLNVNGVIKQDGNLDQMIWKVPEIIAELSRLFVLAAGDIILTGTPAGVGAVHRGDRINCGVDGIATLSLTVA